MGERDGMEQEGRGREGKGEGERKGGREGREGAREWKQGVLLTACLHFSDPITVHFKSL